MVYLKTFTSTEYSNYKSLSGEDRVEVASMEKTVKMNSLPRP